MTTTKLIWHKANDTPDHDCEVLVLCEWNFGDIRLNIFCTSANANKEVQFSEYPVIAWAEINMEEIERGILNYNFNEDFVNFLHNNIKNI